MPPQTASLLRVLLVEDEEDFAEMLQAWVSVRPRPFTVHFHRVATLDAALQALRDQHEFDAVALGLELPDCPDDDLTFGVRELASVTDAPPVVVLTAVTPELGAQATRDGAADFLVKSSNPEHFEAVLRALRQASIRHRLTDEREELMVRLQSHNGRLERLARALAHDLLTPMTIAYAAVETAQTLLKRDNSGAAHGQLDMALRRLRQLAHDLESVLEEALSDGRGTVPLRVAEVAERSYTNLTSEERARLNLVTQDGPPVRGLPGALRQVFQNIMTNAVHHNEGPVTLQVHAIGTNGDVEIIVDDDGRGWPDDFGTLQADGHSGGGSTGIGMTTIEQAMASMSGTVLYENAPGGGARHVLRLPRAVEDEPDMAEASDHDDTTRA